MEAFTFDTTEQILLAATGTLFIIQALYYLCLYNRIHLRSRAVKRGNVHFSQELPPVSVIICAREECENLRRNLKAVLEQDYPNLRLSSSMTETQTKAKITSLCWKRNTRTSTTVLSPTLPATSAGRSLPPPSA